MSLNPPVFLLLLVLLDVARDSRLTILTIISPSLRATRLPPAGAVRIVE